MFSLRLSRTAVLSLSAIALLAALQVVLVNRAGAQNTESDAQLLREHLPEYLNNVGYCCIPAEALAPITYNEELHDLSGGGLCETNYPDISVCKASGGKVFTERSGLECSKSCGAQLKLFYCQNRGGPSAPSCFQAPVSGEVGYSTASDCETACLPQYTQPKVTIACACPGMESEAAAGAMPRAVCFLTLENEGSQSGDVRLDVRHPDGLVSPADSSQRYLVSRDGSASAVIPQIASATLLTYGTSSAGIPLSGASGDDAVWTAAIPFDISSSFVVAEDVVATVHYVDETGAQMSNEASATVRPADQCSSKVLDDSICQFDSITQQEEQYVTYTIALDENVKSATITDDLSSTCVDASGFEFIVLGDMPIPTCVEVADSSTNVSCYSYDSSSDQLVVELYNDSGVAQNIMFKARTVHGTTADTGKSVDCSYGKYFDNTVEVVGYNEDDSVLNYRATHKDAEVISCATRAIRAQAVMCSCTIEGDVQCDVRLSEVSPVNQAETTSSDAAVAYIDDAGRNPLLGQTAPGGSAVQANMPTAPGGSADQATTPSSTDSTDINLDLLLQGGSVFAPEEQGFREEWVKSLQYAAGEGDFAAIGLPTCGDNVGPNQSTTCTASVTMGPETYATVRVTMERAAIGREDPNFYSAELMAKVQDATTQADDQATGPANTPVTGVIPAPDRCADTKTATLQCWLGSDEQGWRQQSSSEIGGRLYASYMIKIPADNIQGPFEFIDGFKGYFPDNSSCLKTYDDDTSTPLITVADNVVVWEGNNRLTDIQACPDDGTLPSATCCNFSDLSNQNYAQISCTIIPATNQTSPDYWVEIKDIEVDQSPSCISSTDAHRSLRNQALFGAPGASTVRQSNETDTEITSCGNIACSQCGAVTSQSACESYTNTCTWRELVGPVQPGEPTGSCVPDMKYCPGYVGCCYFPDDGNGNAAEDPLFVSAWINNYGESPLVNQADHEMALRCFGIDPSVADSSATPTDQLIASVRWTTYDPVVPDVPTDTGDSERCYAGYTPPASYYSSSYDSSYSSEYVNPPVRPDVWCPSMNVQDIQMELAEAGSWLPDFDVGTYDLSAGLVYFRQENCIDGSNDCGRDNPGNIQNDATGFFNNGSLTDDAYANFDDVDPTITAGLQQSASDGLTSCMEGKNITLCLMGRPGQKNYKCGVTDLDACQAPQAGAVPGTPMGTDTASLWACEFLAGVRNGVAMNDNAAQAGIGGGQAAAVANAVGDFFVGLWNGVAAAFGF